MTTEVYTGVMSDAKLTKKIETALHKAVCSRSKMWDAIYTSREDTIKAIQVARESGMSVREIGKELGMSGQRVGYLMRRFKVK